MLKPKVGDMVRLKPFKVVKLEVGYFTCYGQDSFGYESIEEILPRPLAVGDRVRHLRAGECLGTVVAVLEYDAFIDWDATPYAARGAALNARDRITELVCLDAEH